MCTPGERVGRSGVALALRLGEEPGRAALAVDRGVVLVGATVAFQVAEGLEVGQ